MSLSQTENLRYSQITMHITITQDEQLGILFLSAFTDKYYSGFN